MIIDLSDSTFKHIFNDKCIDLPIRWDGKDFIQTLRDLLKKYVSNLCHRTNLCECQLLRERSQYDSGYSCRYNKCYIFEIKTICANLIKALEEYYKGFPAGAYNYINEIMQKLILTPVKIYPKSGWSEAFEVNDPLHLFRVVKVNDDIIYQRSRIFHAPYNLRHKVSTCRYSIAGYPSLYLGTNVELCLNELHCDPYKNAAICSKFELNRRGQEKIDVIELAIKPRDFLEDSPEFNYIDRGENRKIGEKKREVDFYLLKDKAVRRAYLLWYPIIAACSFIRAYKSDPFAPEYVIPQLLMQWIRNWNSKEHVLFGLRYFSCASKRASDLGFNYVFPTSGDGHQKINDYCKVLVDSFKVSIPRFIHEKETTEEFEQHLKRLSGAEFDYIYN